MGPIDQSLGGTEACTPRGKIFTGSHFRARISTDPCGHANMKIKHTCVSVLALGLLLAWVATSTWAVTERVVEMPVLAAIRTNDRGVFNIMLVWWDRQPEPDPIALRWLDAGVRLKGSHLDAMANAFNYALEQTPEVRHTGTVSVQGVAYRPTSTDGPSAGSAMAVAFLALFRGDTLRRGVAITGSLEAGGEIGPVGAVADKIRAAAREGYKLILIPSGQLYDTRSNLGELALELSVAIKEVGTVHEAYEYMTGRRF